MQVAVGQDDEAAVLRLGVAARLLLVDQRVFVLGLGLQHQQRKTARVEQQEIDEAAADLLEIVAQRIQLRGADADAGLEDDVGRRAILREETPARRLQQRVDLDAGGGFLRGHACSCDWRGV